METILLFREIYLEAIRSISSFLVKNYMKVYSWFTFGLLVVVLYAFLFRLTTGFSF